MKRSRSAGASPLPRLPGLERGQDRARRRGLVQRVEVDARRALLEQVGALERRVGDPELGDRLVALLLVASASSCSNRAGGIEAPHIVVKRLTCSKFVIGMMPAMIGTSMPNSRARSTNLK